MTSKAHNATPARTLITVAAIALVILWLILAVLLVVILRNNGGQFTYTIDDPYIHTTIARNLVEHGVWGINAHEFSSASSSLGWTLLIAATYLVFGVNQYSPLVLNFIFATAVVVAVLVILKRHIRSDLYVLFILLALIAGIPLAPIVYTGQEHVMQLLVTIVFAYLAALVISGVEAGREKRYFFWLLALAPLLTLARYEGLAVAAAVCFALLLRRRWVYAIAIGGMALLPVALFGIISRANGSFFLPNAIVLKSRPFIMSSVGDFFDTFVWSVGSTLTTVPHFLMLLTVGFIALLATLAVRKQRFWEDRSAALLAVFLLTALLHAEFGAYGWFYRYEAYVVALGIVALGFTLDSLRPSWRSVARFDRDALIKAGIFAAALLLLAQPLLERSLLAHRQTRYAAGNIYDQNYQMGLFLNEYYRGEGVAVNDIGATSYLGDARILDLWGLGNAEVVEQKRRKGVAGLGIGAALSVDEIDRLATAYGVRLAIVNESWFTIYGEIRLPAQWVRVGQWTMIDNVITDNDTVTFYAVDPDEAPTLIANLKDFSDDLPATVIQSGKYIESV
ncbi:MAG: hypothetical protein ACYC5A_10700 [Thermoleophilia bacterium]